MGQPTATALHTDHYVGDEKKRRRRKEDELDPDIKRLEEEIYKRDFSTEKRKALAGEGKALSDGSYPIEVAADLKPAAILARSGHGNVSGARSLIARRAKALGVKNPLAEATSKAEREVEHVVRLIKGEFEGKVYGVVLEPGLEDSQGDIASAEEIEKACHEHMEHALAPDVQHSGREAGAVLIENYIAPQDIELEGEPVRKGAWVQAYLVKDPIVKQEIAEGKLTGFSMEGAGVRVPVAA